MGHLPIEYPDQVIHKSLQQCIDHVGHGLALAQMPLPKEKNQLSHMWIRTSQDNASSPEELVESFQTWVLVNGFRDAIEAINLALLQCFRIASLWSLEGQASLNSDGGMHFCPRDKAQVQIIMGKESEKFERKSLPEKLEHLEQKCNIPRTTLEQELLSLVAARNCLVHRDGIVGLRDVNDSSDHILKMRWQGLAMMISDESGALAEQSLPFISEADAQIQLTKVARVKTFKLGELIRLSSQEFCEMCLTLVQLSHELYDACLRVQRVRMASDVQP